MAIDELRKLTRGNKEGNTFTAKTSNLRLPVVGGGVKRYKGNMAEIAGAEGGAGDFDLRRQGRRGEAQPDHQ